MRDEGLPHQGRLQTPLKQDFGEIRRQPHASRATLRSQKDNLSTDTRRDDNEKLTTDSLSPFSNTNTLCPTRRKATPAASPAMPVERNRVNLWVRQGRSRWWRCTSAYNQKVDGMTGL